MVDRTSRRQFVTLQTILWFLLFGCLMDHSNGSKETIRVVCISDTHDMHTKVKIPDGDILIHAGLSFRNFQFDNHVIRRFYKQWTAC